MLSSPAPVLFAAMSLLFTLIGFCRTSSILQQVRGMLATWLKKHVESFNCEYDTWLPFLCSAAGRLSEVVQHCPCLTLPSPIPKYFALVETHLQ
jgi:hypothetical protein